MGACASVPKGMRDENAARAPEPQEEETADKEEGEENKAEISHDKEVDKKVVEEGDKAQSLQSLLHENETPQPQESINEEKSTTQTEAVPSEPVNVEKPKPEELPVAIATTPISKDEEKKTEVNKEQK